jgi:Gpi18-like mannosyltransferase
VTGSGSGAPDDRDTTAGLAGRRRGRQILIVMAIGLIVRLIMAYAFEPLRGSGFKTDLDVFRYWADNLGTHGPFGFYARGFFADYTPGYLYVLWLVGVAGHVFGGIGDLIKLPAILTDIGLGYVVYLMARDLGAIERRATLAGALVIVNPITWFDSVVWGQVDSFGTVFLLLAVRELWRGRSERAAILAVVAALIKPQLAILVPILALVVIRRSLRPEGGWGDDEPVTPTGTRWERRTVGRIRILTTAATGFLTAVALSAPFGLSVVSVTGSAPFIDSALIRQMISTAATYPYVSVNAYNLWALFPVNGASMATAGQWLPDAPIKDATAWAQIAGIPAGLVGALLLIVIAVLVSVAVARRPDRLTILVGVCVLALAFFAVPTRVHERYLFPLFALAAILAAFSWRWRVAYVAAGIATFLNMYVVLASIYPDNPSISDWLGIGNGIRSFWGVASVALLHTAVFLWAVTQLRASRRRALAASLAEASIEPPEPELAPEPARPLLEPVPLGEPAPVSTAPWPPDIDALPTEPMPLAPSAPGSARRLVPAWFDRPSLTHLGPVDWLIGRMSETPLRPDRSRELDREGGGRLDRLDLWIVVVLVVSALLLRGFRLADPPRMHFDEVYHARTATEFLQDWRYGIEHSIYEWTHPHLAKYAMAAGIVLFAGHDIEASSQLGVTVRDAAIEPRRADVPGSPVVGNRVWIATGSELVAYDLQTRAVEARFPVPGAAAVAFDATSSTLYVGTDDGQLLALAPGGVPVPIPVATPSPTASAAGSTPSTGGLTPSTGGLTPLETLGGAILGIEPFDNGQTLAVRLAGDVLVMVDPATGEETGRRTITGLSDLTSAGDGDAVTAVPLNVKDPAAVAARLADILGGQAATYETQLRHTDTDTVVLDATLTGQIRTALQKAITAGELDGVVIGKVPLLAVADAGGVDLLTARATIASRAPMPNPAIGVALVSGAEDGTQLYVTTTDGTTRDPQLIVIALTGTKAGSGPAQTESLQLPGASTRVTYDGASQLVEILGIAPDGSGSTVYVIEPHAKSVFADHRLPFTPSAWVLDHNDQFPASSQGAVLAFASDGEAASLDVGHYDFSWRLPGVILGALTAGALYLLTRLLFRRRAVGVLVGLFVLLDGMFFVQSRIAMNDVYTGFFIIAAYLVFTVVWQAPGRWRRFWVLLPVVGVLLGLALASKWVAAYAIGALGILILARSALGRLLLVAGLVALTGVLGWMGLAEGAAGSSGNITFMLVMIGLTLAAVAVIARRPMEWSDEEIRIAVGGPAALGALVVFGAIAAGQAGTRIVLGSVAVTPLALGFALVVAGLAMYVAFAGAARLGFGPLGGRRRPGPPPSPAAEGWLRLGAGFGFPIAWMVLSLVAIPLAVYVISYLPWTAIEGHQIIPGWPPGNAGQTLLELTSQMYGYHNNLTAAHPASSPWWAWPLNLKPVWFFQAGYADSTGGAIYDAGNLVIWWLGIPAMAFAAWQAFRRHSLPLALIVVGFLCQWISWARIDRAAFEYHYYTSLPFVVVALAYLVAEIWHGASRRTWWFVRIAAAVTLMGPVILWLLRYPLCSIAGVDTVNKGSQACHGNPGNLVITPAAGWMVVVGIVTLVLLIRELLALSRPRPSDTPLGPRDLVRLAATAVIGGLLLAFSGLLPSADPIVSLPGIVPELVALVVAVPLGLVAIQVMTARDARRFVAGLVAAAAIWFVILYPNIAALPLPSTVVNAYQGLLPTYLYPFQFTVNTVGRNASISFTDPKFAMLMIALVIATIVTAYLARSVARPAPLDPGPPVATPGPAETPDPPELPDPPPPPAGPAPDGTPA